MVFRLGERRQSEHPRQQCGPGGWPRPHLFFAVPPETSPDTCHDNQSWRSRARQSCWSLWGGWWRLYTIDNKATNEELYFILHSGDKCMIYYL